MFVLYSAVMWPKLQLQQEKPHWVRLDFDLMQESSDEGEGDDDRSPSDKEVNYFYYYMVKFMLMGC